MSFHIIQFEDWDRREYFEHYYSFVPCTYSMSVKLDITNIKHSKRKLYPSMLYLISKVINDHREFRMSFDEKGRLGYFDKMHPSYTVFHKGTETFSNLWTEYSEDFDTFYRAYQQDCEAFGSVGHFLAKPNMPANCFTVSMIPWTTFEAFHLNLQKGYHYLFPIFTMGTYVLENGRYKLPFIMQVHHAVCDGFHTCRFINELQELIDRF